MSTTIYKVVYINDMLFCQERNFTSQAEAVAFAGTISTWAEVLKIVSTDNIIVVTIP